MTFPELRRSCARVSPLCFMNIIHWIIVYMVIINVCVFGGGGSRGGGGIRGGGLSRGGGGSRSSLNSGSRSSLNSGSRSRLNSGSRVLVYGSSFNGLHQVVDQGEYHETHEESHAHEPPSYSHSTKRLTYFTYYPIDYISFRCRNCNSSEQYPVYKHMLPSYVFAYIESFCRYREVLTGLSLYNLARTNAENYSHYYTPRPNEICSLQIVESSHFEEIEFPCFMISTFIEPEPTTKVNYSSLIDISLLQIDVSPFLTDRNSALEVTDEQKCVICRNLTIYKKMYFVPCALLIEYANSLTESGIPAYIWLPILPVLFGITVTFIRFVWFPDEKVKEDKEYESVKDKV
uniref:Uncharacterized protein n=1 Tax=Heliothis virescens TaxID=7102 RepID=A0A2A4JA64_HELVI